MLGSIKCKLRIQSPLHPLHFVLEKCVIELTCNFDNVGVSDDDCVYFSWKGILNEEISSFFIGARCLNSVNFFFLVLKKIPR
jgi:hypothetical protein